MQMRVKKNQSKIALTGKNFLARFARDEEGALLVFAVYVFLIMLMVGGIGVDLMHFERNRAEMQNTLDRAVLAAADLDQTLPPTEVVADYFNKSGLGSYLSSVVVDEGEGYRTVSGTASVRIDTQFMHMTGVDSLAAITTSTAEERVDVVEISLVLDVSGSMNSNSRLSNLKVAARDFIDEMVANTEAGKLSVSIIPYATQVSAPVELFQEFNVVQEQNYSRCINFESSDFNSTSIDPLYPYEQTMHFDPWYTRDGRDDSPNANLVTAPVCEDSSAREILVMENDADILKNYISNLSAGGNTSIDIGMKWGSALIDPAMNPVIQSMIGQGSIDAQFATRPYAYDDSDALKVIVLMTDGRNTNQYYIKDGFRSGDSNVWWNDQENRYSIYDPSSDEYYWRHNGNWYDHPYGDNEDGDAARLSYADLWAYTTVKWNRKYNYRPWMGNSASWNSWYYDVRGYVGSTTKNTRTKAICDAVKAQQVIVFAIGFEAPSSGQAVLANCASSPSHYFNVIGGEALGDAFASIASSIRKLRLTQ